MEKPFYFDRADHLVKLVATVDRQEDVEVVVEGGNDDAIGGGM